MRLTVVALGERMPGWVAQGVAEYAKRFPRECALEIVSVPAAKRNKSGDTAKAIQDEGKRMLAALPQRGLNIALDERGRLMSTEQWAALLREWMLDGVNPVFLIGGADGLAPECKERADQTWSLSKLTLPHPLVRVLLVEQLYRAWTIVNNHPYHRS
ncbi:23S rRNA (pseudouridine(1915)-N(3))-methyltransferase [hydrothermal vent metagenome]|uniref:23S rRNA (Pseudouridine(1915)-N(3))-methyltransferase n=1 Tax=hydrothermal vent metagenome TaxID=652676 RepID=A0A3B0ZKK5_9ZZZZ